MEQVMDIFNDGYPEVVDADHFDTAMQGVIDSVEGAETFSNGYTDAQKFLFSCMESSGTFNSKQIYAGMEGMVSDGLSSVWEYIKKIFKGIWNFFFGDGEDSATKEVDKVKEDVKENAETLKKVTNPTTEEEKKATVAKVKTLTKKIQADPKTSSAAKAKAKSIEEKIDGKGGKVDGKALFLEIANGQRKEDLVKFTEACKSLEAKCTAAVAVFDKDRSDEFKLNNAIKEAYQTNRTLIAMLFKEFPNSNEWKTIKQMSTIPTAEKAQALILVELEEMKKGTEHYRQEKIKLNQEISKIQADMNSDKAKKGDPELKKVLADTKLLASSLSTTHSHIKQFFGALRRVSDEINRFCLVK